MKPSDFRIPVEMESASGGLERVRRTLSLFPLSSLGPDYAAAKSVSDLLSGIAEESGTAIFRVVVRVDELSPLRFELVRSLGDEGRPFVIGSEQYVSLDVSATGLALLSVVLHKRSEFIGLESVCIRLPDKSVDVILEGDFLPQGRI